MMKNTVITVILLSVLMGVLFYFGGYILLTGLGVISLTFTVLSSYFLGARMAAKLMQDGAEIAIKSASKNDEFDATKIKALADLSREIIKMKQEQVPVMPPPQFPHLPALQANFDVFEDTEL